MINKVVDVKASGKEKIQNSRQKSLCISSTEEVPAGDEPQQLYAFGRPSKKGNWTESALKVLQERYLRRNGSDVLETPEDMCWRVAVAIAEAEKNWGKTEQEIFRVAEKFYGLTVERLFIPNSPTLMNAGKKNGLQYSACYVLPVGDSMGEIFETIKRAALIHQSGGGTGFAFSRLRPKDSPVKTTGGTASGPVSFLRVFNAATEAVKQGGTRRGANMAILSVDHPDILEFISCKLDGGITNFNISVAITDQFMQALYEDKDYELVNPYTGRETGKLSAKEVFNRIVQAAWQTGDPGLFFVDRANSGTANPVPDLLKIESTNPCGEQSLPPNDACNLGSINLARFVKNGNVIWDKLENTIRLSVQFLDDVIEVNPYPLQEINETVKANRRIGLGMMGWADMLVQLGIPYDSDEALALAGKVMKFVREIGHDQSAKLAVERGPFPNWPRSIYKEGTPLRNSTITTIAPTGTISIIAGCSSGIEPLFAVAFSHIVGDRHLRFVNPYFEQMAKERGFYTKDLMDKVVSKGTVRGLAGVPEDIQRLFVTAHEIDLERHVRMQAAFQKSTDNGVSKTINLPGSATPNDIANAYLLAYKLGCLGITVFRDGCKGEQVLHSGRANKNNSKAAAYKENAKHVIKPRPRFVQGTTYRANTPLGTAFITVNQNGNGVPFEVFANVGKAGSDTASISEAIGRLVSLCLRLPSPLSPTERLQAIVKQLSGIGGGRYLGYGQNKVRSLPDAIAQVLAEHLGEDETWLGDNGDSESHKIGDLCPECGNATFVLEERCQKCHSCGYSEC